MTVSEQADKILRSIRGPEYATIQEALHPHLL